MKTLETAMRWFPVALALTSTAATLALCAIAVTAGSLPLSCTAALCGIATGLMWLMCD